MLRFFAHCWLMLSLLVAPLQFFAAEIAVPDNAGMKCEMMDLHAGHDMQDDAASMDHSMGQDGCECPEQCKVSCASAHISLGINSIFQFLPTSPESSVNALTTSIHGIVQHTELRPPKA